MPTPFPAGPPVHIVENHHEVLPFWSALRRRLGLAPVVLTLDFHTDTLPAFDHCRQHGRPHPPVGAALTEVLPLLRHDEHLDYALQAGFIRQAFVCSHVNFSRDVNPAIQILHDPATPSYPQSADADAGYRRYADRVLETDYLSRRLRRAEAFQFRPGATPFILDIDLDYFQTAAGMKPQTPQLFHHLIRQAAAVTISRETIWVELLRLAGETIDADNLLAQLRQHIDQAGSGEA